MQKNRFIHCLYLIIILLVISCGAYVLDSAQYNLRTSFASGDYDKTVELLNNFESSEVYEEKDAVLLDLEMGTAHHFARNYAQSNQNFESAEYEIEDLYTKSVSRAIKSFLVNDTILAYDGEDYEDIYLNAFKALNYIHLGDLDAALIESRRISYKLSQLNIKYKDIVTALSEADTTKVDTDKWKTGETNIQNSSMGHFLSTILYSKQASKMMQELPTIICLRHIKTSQRQNRIIFLILENYKPYLILILIMFSSKRLPGDLRQKIKMI